MSEKSVFYICPRCFRVCETEMDCHAHQMIECYAGDQGDEIRKPMKDRFGNLVSRAPRWYLEAKRWIPAWSPMPNDYFKSLSRQDP